ncbi:lysophosphatidic acid receptor 2b isoform X1 [Alosa alosa]|uniref:lysophosphatidic acid receptor 2b isoform X1 n=1 Tax=Alosa alosa TaxID=278164 RepID=UPI0020151172|nr:lysophosphatidic acid receptor 2b isoform X1 [Alosa alosa]XP_048105428.1 lysophosphatidic acid receptor 2b isoform X1 [Alosa alosa]
MDTEDDDQPGCYYNKSVEFFYNKSGKNISLFWRKRDYVVVTLGMGVCIIVILANILVMTAIFINRRFHFPIYYLLGNLAAADLFAGTSYLFLMFHTGPWTIHLTKQRWFIRQGLIDTSLTASVINLLAIAVERHQTIFTMQLHSTMTNRRVVLLILGIWSVAIVMGLVPTMGWHCLCDLDGCSTMAPMYSRSYLIFWAVLNLLTFSIMVAVYTRIFLYVRHKSHRMSQHTTQAKHKETVENLMKTVTMILGAFVICWTPGLVVLLLDGLDCTNCHVLSYEKYFLILAECNSLVNPIIYSYRDKDMRRTFRKILCYLCPARCKQAAGGSDGDASAVRFNTLEQEVLSESNGTQHDHHPHKGAGEHKNGMGDRGVGEGKGAY